MKEMLGGCCVCSDERGWTENPLVYCDGQGCTVAVHQGLFITLILIMYKVICFERGNSIIILCCNDFTACYGIVTVPTGPWYCRKCESQERSARVVSFMSECFENYIVKMTLELFNSAANYAQVEMELLREQIRLDGHTWSVHFIYQKLDLVT